ncbi:MAG: haloacid dehalogenase-like hydrolase, partial [Lachnospiraceae bacterium]|nr:haloacid dehalogenase-like hydrolase [Lachnospiraceae bacterium]
MKQRKAIRTVIVIAAALLVTAAAAMVGFLVFRASKKATMTKYWAADSAAAENVRAYVDKVTDPNDRNNYIPVRDRIAVFDMDGTLTCETYYTYYDTMMFIEFCLRDHPERVSEELKQVAASIKPGYLADETLARNFAKAYAGMTVQELYDYAVEFGKKFTSSFNNMRYIDNFYLPMVELVQYLYEHDFTIYVISGTERTTTRAIVANSPIRDYVTPNHVIGTDFEVKQKGHEEESSNMNFKYENGDELVITGGFIQKNLNCNKDIFVEREIVQRPV